MSNKLAETWAHTPAGFGLSAAYVAKGWTATPNASTVGFHGGSAYDRRVLFSSAPINWFNIHNSDFSVLIPMSPKVTWGWRWNVSATSSWVVGSYSQMFTNLYDNAGAVIVSFTAEGGGSIKAYRGNPTTNLLATSPAGVLPNDGAPHMMEIQVYRHASAGTIDWQVDGINVWSVSGLNTAGGASDPAGVSWYGTIGHSQDHYVNEDDGIDPTGFMGNIRNELLIPANDGNYGDWIPSAGAFHYAGVDDVPGSFTDYEASSTVGNKDSFVMTDLDTVTATSIKVVRVNVLALKRELGIRGLKPFVRSNSVDSTLGRETLIPGPINTPTVASDAFPVDPSGGGAWTVARINSIEAGIDVST